MQLHFTNQTDNIIDRAIDNGCAFAVNFAQADLATGNYVVFKFSTGNMPVYLLSRMLKSNADKVIYEVVINPTISGTVTPAVIPVIWLNQQLKPLGSPAPSVTCSKLNGAILTNGTTIADDVANGPPFIARRVLPANTDFYVVVTNSDQSNAHSAAELIFMQLSPSTYS